MKLLPALLFASLASCSPSFYVRQASSGSTTNCTQKYPNNPRACFKGYDLDTNWYSTIPQTGVTRNYVFDITNTTAAPDGRSRQVMLVNGQLPGPTIEANWGDTIKVTVRNKLQNNGSSIHFHGIRQLNNNQNDGVPSLTQCPIAPGQEYTYTWQATEYGSSWYHSHFALQAWEGVAGGIIIHGPAAADYDEDLGSLLLSDWSQQTADQEYQSALIIPGIPQLEGGLLNGTNQWLKPDGTSVGKRLVTKVQAGKRYRLRLVNAAIHAHFKFSIDNHSMKIIAADFTPIKPIDSNVVTIDLGQRYDTVFTANQKVDNYWMRAVPQSFCSNNTAPNNIKAILNYSGASATKVPDTSKWNYGNDVECLDQTGLVPWLPLDAQVGTKYQTPSGIDPQGNPTLYLWKMGKEAFSVRWNDPTLSQQIANPNKNWTSAQNVFQIPKGGWTTFIIQTYTPISHPIHLHGHDFWVLAQGYGTFDPTTGTLNTKNPIRRDTVTLPSQPGTPENPLEGPGGYVVFAFPGDNPGAWLMHCHIGFHASQGFALQLLEQKEQLPNLINKQVLNNTCDKWNAFAKANPYGQQVTVLKGPWESGI